MSMSVPARGVDARLDTMVDEAARVMRGGGIPFDEDKLRETLYKRMAATLGTPVEETPAPEPEPKVNPKKGRTKLDPSKAVAAGEMYWYEKPADSQFMRHFIELRKAGTVGNLLIVGPSGAGKTEGIRRLAEELKVPFYKLDCATTTTEDKWIGHREVNEKGTYFVLSEHLKWLEAADCPPGILLYDEITRVPPNRMNMLLPILDGSQAIFVPDLGRYIRVHPETIIIATANIGAAYGGTYVLDRAVRERFNYTIEREFPPADEEVKILTSATGVGLDEAKVMVDMANKTRRKWETGDLESPISTRTLKAAATLVSTGMSIVQAMEYTALPLYRAEGGDTSERQIVKLILEGKNK